MRGGIFLNLGLLQFLSFVRSARGTLNMLASALGQNLLWGKICDRYKLSTKLIISGEAIAAATYFIVYMIHRTLVDAQASFNAGLSLILGLSLLEFFWSARASALIDDE